MRVAKVLLGVLALLIAPAQCQDVGGDQLLGALASSMLTAAAGSAGGQQAQWASTLLGLDAFHTAHSAGTPGGKLSSFVAALLPGAGGTAASGGLGALSAFGLAGQGPAAVSIDQLTAVVDGIRDKICTSPQVIPGGKAPAVLRGPQLNLTLSMGNCSLAAAGSGNKTVTCFSPSVSYSKVGLPWCALPHPAAQCRAEAAAMPLLPQSPIIFVPKHIAPTEFVDGACVLSKSKQGKEEVTVLYRCVGCAALRAAPGRGC